MIFHSDKKNTGKNNGTAPSSVRGFSMPGIDKSSNQESTEKVLREKCRTVIGAVIAGRCKERETEYRWLFWKIWLPSAHNRQTCW
jgi:hypothetical protein